MNIILKIVRKKCFTIVNRNALILRLAMLHGVQYFTPTLEFSFSFLGGGFALFHLVFLLENVLFQFSFMCFFSGKGF